MTDCNTSPLLFSSLGRKKIVADFSGGTLTSDAGGLLLREVERRMGLIDRLADALHDPRDPARIRHDQRVLLAQRIFALALGYEDFNDHQQLRTDPVLAVLTGRAPNPEEPLASSPTLGRLENRVTRADLVRMSQALVEQFIASHDEAPEELILDFDATDDPVHGSQEGCFFHGYYDHHCFLPLYVFCESRLLVAYLRPSNIDAAHHAWPILKLLVQRLRPAWPTVRILVRADSGFCRWRMMRWCDRHGVGYVLGLARNAALEQQAEPFMQAAETQFAATHLKVRNFHEIEYAARTWDRPRRVIVKAERFSQGPNVRFVVTNRTDCAPRDLYDLYTARGDMENRIKEQQLGLFADRTSCHAFLANQFRLLLSSAAYVLVEALRRTVLAGTELAEAQADTIRLKLFKVAARVVVSVRRVVLRLSSSYPLRQLWCVLLPRLRLLPPPAS